MRTGAILSMLWEVREGEVEHRMAKKRAFGVRAQLGALVTLVSFSLSPLPPWKALLTWV